MSIRPSRAACARALCNASLFVLIASATAFAKQPTPIFAKALKPGDTIMFVAPAGNLDRARVTLAAKRLRKMGFKVRLPENLFRKKWYLAGTDDERAAEINAAFADPDIAAVFPGTGGYGTTRIVDKLDYDVIRRNPKVLVGYSDITGLHIAINQQTGLVTFHTPVPEWGLGTEKNLSPFAAKWFWRALLDDRYRDQDGKRTTGYTIFTKRGQADTFVAPSIFADVPMAETMVEGKARGRLIGGNLSVLHALMGTPYEIETDGKILFLEDVDEAPYRVDRMLSTLRLAGKFDRVAGVVLGHFTKSDDEEDWDDDASMNEVLRDYFTKLGVPVLAQFPVGHVRYNATLPIGAPVELDATRQTLRMIENPVALR
jgi:muramoyltetrapeptide carboxypeptidase